MRAEFINPFLESTIKVVETMAFTKVQPGKPTVKQGSKSWGVVSGVIGLAGEQLTGNLIISFDLGSILGIVSGMLGEEVNELTHDVVDAVGEITNMVSGAARAALAEQGYKFDMASPLTLVGKDVEITQLARGPVITIPFKTDKGEFVAEVTLHPAK